MIPIIATIIFAMSYLFTTGQEVKVTYVDADGFTTEKTILKPLIVVEKEDGTTEVRSARPPLAGEWARPLPRTVFEGHDYMVYAIEQEKKAARAAKASEPEDYLRYLMEVK